MEHKSYSAIDDPTKYNRIVGDNCLKLIITPNDLTTALTHLSKLKGCITYINQLKRKCMTQFLVDPNPQTLEQTLVDIEQRRIDIEAYNAMYNAHRYDIEYYEQLRSMINKEFFLLEIKLV